MSDPITCLNAALEGRYRIDRELGAGGMANVYLAQDLKHERSVALKVLKPELAAVMGPERFLAEIRTTANLTHPHILPLHDSGEADVTIDSSGGGTKPGVPASVGVRFATDRCRSSWRQHGYEEEAHGCPKGKGRNKEATRA